MERFMERKERWWASQKVSLNKYVVKFPNMKYFIQLLMAYMNINIHANIHTCIHIYICIERDGYIFA